MRVIWLWPLLGVIGCKEPDAKKQPCPEGFEMASPGLCLPADAEPTSDTGDPPPDTAPPDPEDTGEPDLLGVSLPSDCAPPEVRPESPLVEMGATDSALDGGPAMKLIDVTADVERSLLWAVGDGGLQALDISDPLAPVRHPVPGPLDAETPRFHHVHAFNAEDDGYGLVYATSWSEGITIFDGTDPTDVTTVRTIPSIGLGDMAQWDDRLYIADQGGTVQTYDISDRNNPAPMGAIPELGTPWRLSVTEQAVYVAEVLNGTILTLDRANPDAPTLAHSIDLAGIQDVDVQDDLLVAAAGHNGVVLYSLSAPLAPRKITQIRFGSAVTRVHLDGNHLWLVDQERLRLIDIRSPMKPQSVGSYATPQMAMDVTAVDEIAWVADWGAVSGYSRTPDIAAPDIRLQFSEVYLRQEGDMRAITVFNAGQYTLEISGVQTEVDGLEVRASGDTIGPNGTGTLYMYWSGEMAVSGEVCLASNDPDTPSLSIPIHSGDSGLNPLVGTAAPDFILTGIDLEGSSGGGPVPATFSQRLLDQRGQPISLLFFSENDITSPAELIEFEHNIWRYFEPAGMQVWGISAGEPSEIAQFWLRLGLTFSLFPDPDADVQETYPMPPALSNADYPQHWVIDADGIIIYAGNFLNPGALRATIAGALE